VYFNICSCLYVNHFNVFIFIYLCILNVCSYLYFDYFNFFKTDL